jgi:4-hydroxy-tetrahydrodipicolinate synthase
MIKGSIVALITPFDESGKVNYKKLKELIKFHIRNHTDGILILGTTGETPTLNEDEQDEIVRVTVKEVSGRVPVIANSGNNNTEKSIAKSIKYEKMGVDALLVITPYYNKPNPSGMVEHFYRIADNVHIPVYIYNVPSRTGSSISVEIVEELSRHPNIRGIKEASGDIGYAAKIARCINSGFDMFSGNDDITVPLMSLGAAGAISVWANIMPKEVRQMIHAFNEGEVEGARKMQLKYLPLINGLFCETNPAPIKEIMNIAGMQVGNCRLPMGSISLANRRLLNELHGKYVKS